MYSSRPHSLTTPPSLCCSFVGSRYISRSAKVATQPRVWVPLSEENGVWYKNKVLSSLQCEVEESRRGLQMTYAFLASPDHLCIVTARSELLILWTRLTSLFSQAPIQIAHLILGIFEAGATYHNTKIHSARNQSLKGVHYIRRVLLVCEGCTIIVLSSLSLVGSAIAGVIYSHTCWTQVQKTLTSSLN